MGIRTRGLDIKSGARQAAADRAARAEAVQKDNRLNDERAGRYDRPAFRVKSVTYRARLAVV
jgi:hypothetical protein